MVPEAQKPLRSVSRVRRRLREWKEMELEGEGAMRMSACTPWSLTVPVRVKVEGVGRVERVRW